MEALQPLVNMLSVFNHAWIFLSVAIGVLASYNFNFSIFAIILTTVFLIFIPFSGGLFNYILGKLVKFLGVRILGV
jgi:hypothetical protein